jgi:hypothetical protein
MESQRDTISFVRAPEMLNSELSPQQASDFDLTQRIWETVMSDSHLVFHLLKVQKTNSQRLTSILLQLCSERALCLCAKLIDLEAASTGGSAGSFFR